MKAMATYPLVSGGTIEVEYDPEASCEVCGEPVISASVGGTTICPWCDTGKCRYCGVQSALVKEEIDGGRSLRSWREHMEWHKLHPTGLP